MYWLNRTSLLSLSPTTTLTHPSVPTTVSRIVSWSHDVTSASFGEYDLTPIAKPAVELVDVTFRALGDDEITAYISTGEPMDKAGAYGIQGYGATIVERVDGDYFSVMGLGLRRLVDLLARVGTPYSFQAR